jgi:hypothetical protein
MTRKNFELYKLVLVIDSKVSIELIRISIAKGKIAGKTIGVQNTLLQLSPFNVLHKTPQLVVDFLDR